ncbi:hypothetical protein PCANC_22101 [Puccinia coronata f. sp. avenae]|uniref:U1-C C2H2-type zinc finger domain-containing protein n=1 Tax=Puccinia coronata f. sp. avenae TaxID=200324 RepID=A0A2N5S4N5_9BASI|nr:hypothetical protein PCANC_22101 [Puccinia coronata f. sp. avenae]
MSEEISSTVEEAVGLQGDRGPGHRPLLGCKPAVTAALATKCAAAVSFHLLHTTSSGSETAARQIEQHRHFTVYLHSSTWGSITVTTVMCSSSVKVRKAHNSGRNHLTNVRDYYSSLGHDKAQSYIDEITRMFETGGGNSTSNRGPGGNPSGPQSGPPNPGMGVPMRPPFTNSTAGPHMPPLPPAMLALMNGQNGISFPGSAPARFHWPGRTSSGSSNESGTRSSTWHALILHIKIQTRKS